MSRLHTYLLTTRLAEHIPEPESFVSCAGDDRLAVRRHGQVEDPIGMASQLGHLGQTRVLPHEDLILRVAVGANLQPKNTNIGEDAEYFISCD